MIENAITLRAISPLPAMFSKDMNCMQVKKKTGFVWKRVKAVQCPKKLVSPDFVWLSKDSMENYL